MFIGTLSSSRVGNRFKKNAVGAWRFPGSADPGPEILQGFREILTGAGLQIEKPTEKSFAREGEILKRALKKALSGRDDALREFAAAARWVDRAAFQDGSDFGQAHQAVLKALDRAAEFVWRYISALSQQLAVILLAYLYQKRCKSVWFFNRNS
jgi:hypothetical protein